MSEQKQQVVEDVLGEFGFRVRYRYLPHWCDVEAWEFIAVFPDGHREFYVKDYERSEDLTADLEAAQHYLTGFIKWDGCSHLEFHEPHMCGASEFKKHCSLLETIYRRAMDLMGSTEDPWDDGAATTVAGEQ